MTQLCKILRIFVQIDLTKSQGITQDGLMIWWAIQPQIVIDLNLIFIINFEKIAISG